MTENTNPKLFNISRQKCSVEQLYWVINQSVNQSTDPFTVKLAKQNSDQDYQKCKRFVHRL